MDVFLWLCIILSVFETRRNNPKNRLKKTKVQGVPGTSEPRKQIARPSPTPTHIFWQRVGTKKYLISSRRLSNLPTVLLKGKTFWSFCECDDAESGDKKKFCCGQMQLCATTTAKTEVVFTQ